MNNYYYKAVDVNGVLNRGTMEAINPVSAHENLTAKGLFVLQVKESGKILKKLREKYATLGVKRKEVIEFSLNLAIMLRAGVPIITALEDITNITTNGHLKSALSDIKKNIQMGTKFSSALDSYKTIFPDVLIRLVTVGEETGRLDISLSEIAGHLQKMEDLSSTVKRALIYPAFSLITTGAAFVFWVAYVLPKIMQVIIDMKVPMPLLTKILFEFSKFAENFWYIFIVFPIMIFITIQIIKLRPSTKYHWDFIKIKLPIVRLVLYNKLLALLSEQLRLLISAGITIDRSFDIAADVVGNEVFKRAILESERDITAGITVFDAVSAHKIFPPLFTRMVAIGESSGNLDQQFNFLAEYYYKIVDDASEKLGKMIEPILLIFLGLLMGLIVAGVLLPMYDVFSKLGTT
ncbi:MAG: type II secretion system F family protein [Syntrophales bacterium]